VKAILALIVCAAATLAGCAVGQDRAGNEVIGIRTGDAAAVVTAATAWTPAGIAGSIIGSLGVISAAFYHGTRKGWDEKAAEKKP
jgi:hypothetical protein